MPISGSTLAPTYARLNVGRLGAMRLDHYNPVVAITVNGTVRTSSVRVDGLTVRDLLDGTPNTATFRVSGFTPTRGQEVKIGLGDMATSHLIFAGHILSVTQVYEGLPANVAYDLNCISYEWLLNRRKVDRYYTATSATAIIQDIIDTFTSGFTYNNVTAGLPTIDEISLTDEDVTGALDRVMRRVGGYWYADPAKDIHAFLTATDSARSILDGDVNTARDLAVSTDLSQVKTRVWVEGGGSVTTMPVEAGETAIPVEETTTWYDTAGGYAKAGPQRLTYTGIVTGGDGALVGTALTPTSALTSAASFGNGLTAGAYKWKVTFVTAAGETTPGPVSNTVTAATSVTAPATAPTAASAYGTGLSNGSYQYKVGFDTASGVTVPGPASTAHVAGTSVTTPASAPTAATSAGSGVEVGAHYYKVTYGAASGETVAGPASSVVTHYAVAAPSTQCAASAALSDAPNQLSVGDYNWKVTFVDSRGGETLAGPACPSETVTAVSAPSTVPNADSLAGAPGLLGIGTYGYKYTFYYASSGLETTPSPADFATTSAEYPRVYIPSAGVESPPVGAAVRWYRTAVGGSTYKFITNGLSSGSYGYDDNTSDAQLGADAPSTNTAINGRVTLTSIPVSGDGTVVRRNIYRTAAGGGTYKYALYIGDNSTTTTVDTVPDASLGANEPAATSAQYQRSALTAIPVSADSNITKRYLYRTTAGGGTYKLLATINDNSTTTYTDSTADASLGANEPVSSTALYNRVSLTAIPTSTDPNVTGRKVYRTVADGTSFLLLTTIGDNSTTTYADSTADGSLGAAAPSSSAALYSRASLTNIPVGPSGVTGRNIYRTVANGSSFLLQSSIANNTATTLTDSTADGSLGAAAPASDTSGLTATGEVVGGSTTIAVTSGTAFESGGGWAFISTIPIRYTGKTTTSLTGVPATGTGALTTTVRYGSEIVAAPMLTGIPASGAGSIAYDIPAGEPCNVLVVRNDATAQTVMATAVGGDGIHEDVLSDQRLSIDGAEDRGDAHLALVKDPLVTVNYQTRDQTTRAGRAITITLSAPTSVSGTYQIQSVTYGEFSAAGTWFPLRTVEASSRRFSFDALLRLIKA